MLLPSSTPISNLTPNSSQNTDNPPPLIPIDSNSNNLEYTPHFILDVIGNSILHYDHLHCDMSPNNPTPAAFSQEHKAPPILTASVLTPGLLHAFQMGCMQYFSQKMISVDKQVGMVMWGLCDPCIQNWYINDTACIDKLSFLAFMMEIHTNWLTDSWEGNIEHRILKCAQGNQPFWDWLQHLQSMNALIIGTYTELDNAALCTHIKSNLNLTLKEDANCKKTHTKPDFAKWATALKTLDDDHLNNEHKLKEMITKDHTTCLASCCDYTHPLQTIPCIASSGSACNTTATFANSAAPTQNYRPPPLPQHECILLATNNGCFKCCEPFVDHLSKHCPTGYPTSNSYRVITEALINTLKNCNKKKKVTVVIPTDCVEIMQSVALVTVMMPHLESCVLGDGSDSEYILTPYHTSHFKWNCYIGGLNTPSDEFVNTLTSGNQG